MRDNDAAALRLNQFPCEIQRRACAVTAVITDDDLVGHFYLLVVDVPSMRRLQAIPAGAGKVL